MKNYLKVKNLSKQSRYKVRFRRRREGKTDYRRRLRLLLSGKTRFVARKTNRYITVQFIDYSEKGDITRVCVSSHVLRKKYNWYYSLKNLPAAYITGYIAGKKALKKGISEAIVDIGLQASTRGNRIYAAVKGAIDAGVKIKCGEEVLPPMERISGAHIASYAKLLKEKNPDLYNERFSNVISQGKDPADIVSEFNKLIEKVKSDYG